MKNLFLAALIAMALVGSAHAQAAKDFRRFEVAWHPLSFLIENGNTSKGGSISVAYRRYERLGFVADLALHQTHEANPVTRSAYRFGPRYYFPVKGRMVPFAQVLAGGGYIGTATQVVGTKTVVTPGRSAFAFSSGAGLDFKIRPWFSWRIVQADYSLLRSNGNNLDGVRLHTGGVFHFGQ